MLALSGTAAGAQRAQIRPTRVKEGGSDTAKRCFRGPHELAFIRSKIFIYPQFASSVGSWDVAEVLDEGLGDLKAAGLETEICPEISRSHSSHL